MRNLSVIKSESLASISLNYLLSFGTAPFLELPLHKIKVIKQPSIMRVNEVIRGDTCEPSMPLRTATAFQVAARCTLIITLFYVFLSHVIHSLSQDIKRSKN